MQKIIKVALKSFACYLVAGATYLVYFRWPDLEGHAHVPFSDFPGFFLFSPLAPAFLAVDLSENSWRALPGALLFGAVLGVSLWLAFRKRQPQKKPSVSGFAWALLFLSGGRMPPPPPQSQIEQEAGERKNREIGRGEES